jgi:hypothetical protein
MARNLNNKKTISTENILGHPSQSVLRQTEAILGTRTIVTVLTCYKGEARCIMWPFKSFFPWKDMERNLDNNQSDSIVTCGKLKTQCNNVCWMGMDIHSAAKTDA